MMKNRRSALAIGGILVALLLFPAGMASGQVGPPMSTWLLVQNTGPDDAQVSVVWYNEYPPNGVAHSLGDTIPGNGNAYYGPDDLPDTITNWRGSIVLYSSEPLLTIGNEVSSSQVSSYSGYGEDGCSSTVYLPDIHSTGTPGGWQTTAAIQNCDSAPVDVDIDVYDAGVLKKHVDVDGVEPGSSYYFESPDYQADLGTNFVGSAIISATGQVASVVNIQNSIMTLTYNGASQGGMTQYLSDMNHTPGGWAAYILVQNLSATTPTTATVTYYDMNGVSKASDDKLIQPNSSIYFSTPDYDAQLGSGFVGGAVVTSTDTDVLALVNVIGVGNGASYNGTSAGGTTILMPDYHESAAWTTYTFVQNITASPVDIGVSYKNPDGSEAVLVEDTLPGNSTHYYHSNSYAAQLPDVGAAVITADTSDSIVGMTNIFGLTIPGDNFLSYNGVSQ